MATVIEKSTMRILESVNTPDYPEDKYLINPDLSKVQGIPEKYLAIKDNAVVEMSAEEKAVIDSALADSAESSPCPYGYIGYCEHIAGAK